MALHEALYLERPDDHDILFLSARRGVPAWLAHVVARGLATDPDRRFPGMTALLEALEHRAVPGQRLRLVTRALLLVAVIVSVAVNLWLS